VTLRRLAVIAALSSVWTLACSDAPGPHELRGPDLVLPPVRPPLRPSDGLLERPDLQALVEAQILRDATPLTRGLSSPDAVVRARAALALASVQDPAAVGGLLDALGDPDPQVRRDAAFALGQTGGFGVGEALLDALRDEEDPSVAGRLLEAVGKQGDQDQLRRLVADHSEIALQAEMAITLGRFGLRSVHHLSALAWLTSRLESPDAEMRYLSSYYFSRVEDPAAWGSVLPAVRGALEGLSVDDPAAIHLLQALRRVEDPVDHAAALGFLRDSRDWRVRVEAAQTLGHPGPGPDTRAALLAALDDPVVNVARAAAQGFARVELPPRGDLDRVESWVSNEAENGDRWPVAEPLLAVLSRTGYDAAVLRWLDTRDPTDVSGQVVGLRALASSTRVDALEELARRAETAASDQVAVAAAELIATRRWALERRRPETHARFLEVLSAFLGESRFDDALPAVAVSLSEDRLAEAGGRATVLRALEEASDEEEAPSERTLALAYGLAMAGDSVAEPVLRRALSTASLRGRFLARSGLESLGFEVETPSRPTPAPDWGRLASLGRHPVLLLDTDRGEIRLRLDAEAAPQTVSALARVAAEGRFAGVPFHRVENNFVIQGGDLTRGSDGRSFEFSLRSEFNSTPYTRGALGMASAGKDTESTQFFITHLTTPHLDGRYSCFGWTESGMDVVDSMRQEDRIRSTSVLRDERGGGG
jgi:peptidylprolyl isomerase